MFTVLYWIFCFAFALDFRGEKGGNFVQYVFLALALVSGGLILVSSPQALRRRPTSIMSVIWWTYLGITLLVAVEAGVDLSQYVRCLLPPLLFALAVNVGQCLAERHYTADDFLRPLLYAGIVSIFWRFIHAVYIQGIAIEMVRYEMLSPAIPLLFASAVASAVLARRMQPLSLASGALAMASVLVSVTRSYILTAGVAVAAAGIAFLSTLLARFWSSEDLRRKFSHVLSGGCLALVTLALLYLIEPVVFERWFQRLYSDGGGKTTQDVTYLTRAAEAKAMWHLLEQDPLRFVYGKGLGANYYWDTTYFPELLEVYDKPEEISQDYWAPGHSVWTYALFSGGFFAVACYVFLFVWVIWVGWAGGKKALRSRIDSPHLSFLPFVVGVCYFSQTLTSNPFGERFSAQILGLFAAMPQIFLARHAVSADRPIAEENESTGRFPANAP